MSKHESEAKIAPNKYRTHTCADIRSSDVGEVVTLSGWVHSRRDHGGLIFIDLRDKWGMTQITFDPQKSKEAWEQANNLRSEFVITVTGEVLARPQEMINPKLDTGEVEVAAQTISVISSSEVLPFELDNADSVHEDIRLKHRFLDLRRPKMQEIMKMRDAFIAHIRGYMQKNGFTEVQTPILTVSSPEGARDFLVPSRLHPGKFYALPQAPQQYKQLLMVGGLDRYFQIAPCFRDEDPRADRHSGAFYQVDLEMSFVEQEDVFAAVEPLMIELTQFGGKEIMQTPFPRIAWHDAMTTYGSDKPDLRFDLPIQDVSDAVRGSAFSVFENALQAGVVHALRVPGGASFSRSVIDEFTQTAKTHGAGGLAYIVVKDEIVSPILKYLGDDKAAAVVEQLGAENGDIIFFGADIWLTVCKALGAVRSLAGDKLQLKDPKKAAWCWIVDFPMYEKDEQTGKIDFSHNPFSMPQGGIQALESTDPITIKGYQYDLALNGFEISSGAIRNHDLETMYKAFEIAGYTKEDVDNKFTAMTTAFKYGAPPHGGIAPGIDRLMMVLLDLPNIRDIYAFPKNGKAQDALMDAPSTIDDALLKDLHITVDLGE